VVKKGARLAVKKIEGQGGEDGQMYTNSRVKERDVAPKKG